MIVGVVENTALAREVVTVAGEAWPEDDFRVFNAVSLERELAAEEREPLLEAMHNPTFGQKERFAALRAEAQARQARILIGAIDDIRRSVDCVKLADEGTYPACVEVIDRLDQIRNGLDPFTH